VDGGGRCSLRKQGKKAPEMVDYRVKDTVVQPRPWIGVVVCWRGRGNAREHVLGAGLLAARRSVSCSWGPRSDRKFTVLRILEQGLMPQITGSYDADIVHLK